MRRFPPAAACLAALGLALAAGCGGGDPEPAALATADVVPASAAAYVSVRTDLDDEQWRRVDELLERFPQTQGGVKALLSRGLAEDGMDYEQDVRPAFGPTVELVWLELAPAAGAEPPSGDVVALTEPEDEGKLEALAAKADEPLVVGEVEGWSALARSEELLDRYREALAQGTLADDETFGELSAELPEESLLSAYAGEQAGGALQGLAPAAPGAVPVGDVSAGVAALEALDEGFRLTGRVRTDGDAAELGQPSGLFEEIPSGAFFALDLGDRTAEAASSGLGGLEQSTGVPLSELAAALEGGAVLFARPAPIIPELTLLSAPDDAEAAKTRLDEALVDEPVLGAARRRQTTIGDSLATVLDFGRLSLIYAAVGDRLVVTTLPDSIRTLEEDGDKLVDDDAFGDAREAAGVEDGDQVVAYADLEQAVGLLEGLSALGEGGVPPEAARGLQTLRSLVAATSTEGDTTTFRLFLGVE